MSVGLLIVTHNRVGEEMLATARSILGICPLKTACVAVSQGDDPVTVTAGAERTVRDLDDGQGVLILTDAFGSTPSNIAVELGAAAGTAVVSGLNLPMLLRVLNYPELDLQRLQEKALSGGRDGVLLVAPPGASDTRQQGSGKP